jgi:hypothetical protein
MSQTTTHQASIAVATSAPVQTDPDTMVAPEPEEVDSDGDDSVPNFLDDDGADEVIIDESVPGSGHQAANDSATSDDTIEIARNPELMDLSEILDETSAALTDTTGMVEIFCENCLQCKHLVPHAQQSFKQCHYSKGNTKCPAAEIQIVIGVDTDRIVRGIMKSMNEQDTMGLARKYQKLSTKPEWVQQRVMAEIQLRLARGSA